MDDLWGDDDDDAGHTELSREWDVRKEAFYNTGYREGLEAGKAVTVQEGFDKGFAEGAMAAFRLGSIRGAVKSLDVFAGQVAGTSNIRTQVEELVKLIDVPSIAAMQQVCEAAASTGASPPANNETTAAQGDEEAPASADTTKPSPNVIAIIDEASKKLSDIGFNLPSPPEITNQQL